MKNLFKYLLLCLISLIGCQKDTESHDSRLLLFRSSFIGELGDEQYDKYITKTDNNPRVKYLDDIIIVTKYVEANACGEYRGDIKVIDNSVVLQYKLISDEVCSSTAVENLTYIIDNPDSKRYKFKVE